MYWTSEDRECTISNGEIGITVSLPYDDIAKKLKLLWPYFLKAQKCKTQEELNLLKDCYEKDIEIEDLNETNLQLEHANRIIEEKMNAYKAVLDKIEGLLASDE